MLQEHGGCERVDITFAATRRAAHLANGAKRGRGREPLVNETRGQARAFLELGGDVANFGGARRVVSVLVKGETDDEPFHLELLAAANHLGDGRALARSAQNETSR
jgi:hypothetical protein